MNNFIELRGHKETIPVEYSQFPAGEEYVKILNTSMVQNTDKCLIIITSADSKTIMQALLVADAVKQINSKIIIAAYLPYIPYGRQDRVCTQGESFSLQVFNDIMKTRVDVITSYDMHSSISTNLFLSIPYPTHYVSVRTKAISVLSSYIPSETLFVSPDKGAIDRTKSMTDKPIAVLDKTRIDNTVKQTASKESIELIKRATHITISDDICDGGGTFLAAASFIKDINPSVKLLLVISHGIFSKGTECLLKKFEDIIVPLDPYNAKHL